MTNKRFTLRVDEELFDKISFVAGLNRRSASKEIEIAIDNYLENFNSEIQTKNGEPFHLSQNTLNDIKFHSKYENKK